MEFNCFRVRAVDRTRGRWILHEFCLPSKYGSVVETALGAGTYGAICEAEIVETSTRVAIKKILAPSDPAFHQTEPGAPPRTPEEVEKIKNIVAKRMFREVALLSHLHDQSVVKVLDMFCHKQPHEEHFATYVVLERMEQDLAKFSANNPPMNFAQIREVMFQVLCGLRFIHKNRILHRDLTPSNILINTQPCMVVKLCDFGLSRSAAEESAANPSNNLTLGVVTVAYRPPEILMECTEYDSSVDIWSAGCIFAELFNGGPLIQPERPGVVPGAADWLMAILKFTGTPTDDVLEKFRGKCNEGALRYVGRTCCAARDLNSMLSITERGATEEQKVQLVSLLSRMLVFDPSQRISAEEALADKLFKAFGPLPPLSEEALVFPAEPVGPNPDRPEEGLTPQDYVVAIDRICDRFQKNTTDV